MEPESSLPHSQVPASCPFSEPARSIPYPHTLLLKILLNIILHLRLGLPSALFPSGFPTKTLYTRTPLLSPIRATWPVHLILLDFFTRTVLVEEYRSFISSLCSFAVQNILQIIGSFRSTRWFKYDRDWFVCKQTALRSSCATLREWSHNLHPPSCSG